LFAAMRLRTILLLACAIAVSADDRRLRGLADAESVVDSSGASPVAADDTDAATTASSDDSGTSSSPITASAPAASAPTDAPQASAAATSNDGDEIISIGIIGVDGQVVGGTFTLAEKIAQLQAKLRAEGMLAADAPNPTGAVPQIQQLEEAVFGPSHTPVSGLAPRLDAVAAEIGYRWCYACAALVPQLETLEVAVYGQVQAGGDENFLNRLDALEAEVAGHKCEDDPTSACDPNDVDMRVYDLATTAGVDLSNVGGGGGGDDGVPPANQPPANPPPTTPGNGGGGGGGGTLDPTPHQWCGMAKDACLATVQSCTQFGSCYCGVSWVGFSHMSGTCSLTNDTGSCSMAWARKPAANVCGAGAPTAPPAPTPAAPGAGTGTPPPANNCGTIDRLLGAC